MKIGDTFTQDGVTYKVIAENEAGLISKVVTEEEATESVSVKRRKKLQEV